MVQEVVGLRFVGVGTGAQDAVGQLGVFVAVVQLAHAHVARGVALGVVGRAVVNAHHLGFQRAEHQLASTPGVLEAAASAAVVEAVVEQAVRAVVVKDLLGQASVDREGLLPAGVQPLVAALDARVLQAFAADAVVRVHVAGHLAAARAGEAAVHGAFLVGNDHDVPLLAALVGDGVGHRPGQGGGKRRQLGAEVQSQRVLVRGAAAFGVVIPLVGVVATSDDAEVAGHVGLLRVFRGQCDAVVDLGGHAALLTGRWTGGRRSGHRRRRRARCRSWRRTPAGCAAGLRWPDR
ncbi:hypothetical protein FQZ97_838630 [compost metagenome]